MSSLVWRGDLLINRFLMHFTTDLLNDIISKRVTTFTRFHHTLMIIFMLMSKLTGMPDSKLIDLSAIFELSSIPLVLFYMYMYKAYLTDKSLFNNYSLTSFLILNIMNCGIAWKMKLVQKLFGIRPVIDLFYNKQLIQ